ncbi:MAG TPA: pyridoxamine 5'-phosphate oxidase family protein, partial [Acidimicrobiia bacterium]|nr:pyridoxamine 5'-phosphate oxidase family protein [Acidimicrobiia bacterium]
METSGRVVADVEVVANVELPDVALGRLEALSVDECLRLLAANHVGRLAVVVKEQPVVVPVNYALMGRQIVFRSDTGTKLHASAGRRVAFEI